MLQDFIFKVNISGGYGSPYIHMTVGDECEGSNIIGQTEELDAIQLAATVVEDMG
jgi:hypothetical protein